MLKLSQHSSSKWSDTHFHFCFALNLWPSAVFILSSTTSIANIYLRQPTNNYCQHTLSIIHEVEDRFLSQEMQHVPKDFVLYDLLPLLSPKTAGCLAKTCAFFFFALRHRIYRSDAISATQFMKQSERRRSRIIGLSSSASVEGLKELRLLLQYISSHHTQALRPLLHLEIKGYDRIQRVIFPDSILTMKFDRFLRFNYPLVDVTLPSHLEKLEFDHYFDQSLAATPNVPVNCEVKLVHKPGKFPTLRDLFAEFFAMIYDVFR